MFENSPVRDHNGVFNQWIETKNKCLDLPRGDIAITCCSYSMKVKSEKFFGSAFDRCEQPLVPCLASHR